MGVQSESLEALRINRANAPRRRFPRALAALLLVAVALVILVIWWLNRPQPIVVRTVLVQEAATSKDRTLLNASGYVTARREATVSSKVTGKVIEVLVEEGMTVDADQVLARIDSSNVDTSLKLAEAQLHVARQMLGETDANLEQAKRDVERYTLAVEARAAPRADLEKAQTTVKSLEARLLRQRADIDVAQREVEVWSQQIDDSTIRAPFAGVVTTKNAQPGEMISPMSVGGFTRTGICTIVDMSSLEIEVDVSESYINRVQPGMPVEATLDSYPNWRIPASVIAIIPTADRQKATVKVRVGFKQLDPRILPDMSVKVAFQSGAEAVAQQRGAILPKNAVMQRDGRDIVWVVRDGKVERRAITIGDTLGDIVTITAGVAAGERVVVDAPDSLTDGAQVTEEKR